MNRLNLKVTLSFSLLMIIISCRKNTEFPDIPMLKWKSAKIVTDEGFIEKINLTVFFTDGDGDIGREDLDNLDPCKIESYDFRIKYFEKVNGSFIEIFPRNPCLPFHNIIPNLTPDGQNKTLEGDLTTTFSYLAYPENAGIDSVRFNFQLFDRDGNESNILTTPVIVIPD